MRQRPTSEHAQRETGIRLFVGTVRALTLRRGRSWKISAQWPPRLGGLFAASGLALCICAAAAGPGAAAPYAGSRAAGVPVWVPQSIDHPTPYSSPLPSALTEERQKDQVVVTPTQARAVLLSIWNLRAWAFDTDNRSLMAEFEAGPALESDEVTCGCNTRAVRGPIDADTLLVPNSRTTQLPFWRRSRRRCQASPTCSTSSLPGSRALHHGRLSRTPGNRDHDPLTDPRPGKGVSTTPPVQTEGRIACPISSLPTGISGQKMIMPLRTPSSPLANGRPRPGRHTPRIPRERSARRTVWSGTTAFRQATNMRLGTSGPPRV